MSAEGILRYKNRSTYVYLNSSFNGPELLLLCSWALSNTATAKGYFLRMLTPVLPGLPVSSRRLYPAKWILR